MTAITPTYTDVLTKKDDDGVTSIWSSILTATTPTWTDLLTSTSPTWEAC